MSWRRHFCNILYWLSLTTWNKWRNCQKCFVVFATTLCLLFWKQSLKRVNWLSTVPFKYLFDSYTLFHSHLHSSLFLSFSSPPPICHCCNQHNGGVCGHTSPAWQAPGPLRSLRAGQMCQMMNHHIYEILKREKARDELLIQGYFE